MQSTYDLNTIIIVIAFLIVLILISVFINKKKDLLRSRLGSISTLNIISNYSMYRQVYWRYCELEMGFW